MDSVVTFNPDTGEIVGPVSAEAVNEAHRLAENCRDSAVAYAIECGRLLAAKKKETGHGLFRKWIMEYCDFEQSTATRYLKAFRQNATGVAIPSLSSLFTSKPENHLAQGTGENEWYTPAEVIERVRDCLGVIDLDPASNPLANETVKATRYLTADDDGLTQEWIGKVWLNPPYSRDLMPVFVQKLIDEYTSGRTTEAMLVSHNNTETRWFQSLAKASTAICFPSTRIKFYGRDDGDVASPVSGQVFFYLGPNLQSFLSAFGPMGVIVRCIDGDTQP